MIINVTGCVLYLPCSVVFSINEVLISLIVSLINNIINGLLTFVSCLDSICNVSLLFNVVKRLILSIIDLVNKLLLFLRR